MKIQRFLTNKETKNSKFVDEELKKLMNIFEISKESVS